MNSQVRNMLKRGISTVGELYLNKKCLPQYTSSKVDLEYYFPHIVKSSVRVKKSLLLGYFNISTEQLNHLVPACSHLEFLSFNCWNLTLTENLDFLQMKSSKIRVLALTGWGKDFSGGSVDEQGLEWLIKAISGSPMKDSLRQLSLTWWGVSKETVEGLLEKEGIEGVEIWV